MMRQFQFKLPCDKNANQPTKFHLLMRTSPSYTTKLTPFSISCLNSTITALKSLTSSKWILPTSSQSPTNESTDGRSSNSS
ncbi:hypothetical protein EUTSA_v10009238mg [Eutrema salsugineum]|uniref:Uncharacterized protein n=1 Tax=Eutrema salsugineum TaxID=72664 RepID=V4KU37_EUTSA|nr:hypothetical protein EUTSA_v10009238mg [Eutrema salsugineum]